MVDTEKCRDARLWRRGTMTAKALEFTNLLQIQFPRADCLPQLDPLPPVESQS